ncbi:hypothetical protein KSS87_012457, partial [Heliosperma pusillum]
FKKIESISFYLTLSLSFVHCWKQYHSTLSNTHYSPDVRNIQNDSNHHRQGIRHRCRHHRHDIRRRLDIHRQLR